jgi:hypothetical protein
MSVELSDEAKIIQKCRDFWIKNDSLWTYL